MQLELMEESDTLKEYSQKCRRIRLIEEYAGLLAAAYASNVGYSISHESVTAETTVRVATRLADEVIEATAELSPSPLTEPDPQG